MKRTKLRRKSKANKLLLLTMILSSFLCVKLSAQVTIGSNDPPQKFSILEIISNKQAGMRLPHLTTAERNTLSATPEFIAEKHRGESSTSTAPGLALGLTIYNSDNNCIEYWDGYKWVSLCTGTANIKLTSPCGDYDPQNLPVEPSDGTHSGCEYTPTDTPVCTVSSGKAYDVYLIGGTGYANLTIDPVTSAFLVSFSPNKSSLPRNAIVRIVNNCTGEFSDFIFPQAGATCPSVPDPILNQNSLTICRDGSSFVHITNAVPGTDYIWTYAGVIVHTGTWYEIKRAGTYKVYSGLMGCGTPVTLTVTDSGTTAPVAIHATVTNGGILCSGRNVVLGANTTKTIEWYHNGQPKGSNNPKTVSGASVAGEWFAVVKDGGCISASSNTLTLIDNTSVSTALPTPIALVNGLSLTGGSIVICDGGSLRLEVTNLAVYPSGTNFEWFNNGISIGKGTAPIIYTPAPGTTHMQLSVTASDQSGSCPNTALSNNTSVTLTASSATSINNGAAHAAVCGGAAATLIADLSGAVAYEWMLEGVVISGKTTQMITATQPGNYTVRYQDSNGCWSKISTQIEVVVSAPISLNWNTVPTDVLKGETKVYSITSSPAAAQYDWSYESLNPAAIASITPMGDGTSASVVYGIPTAYSTNVTLKVKTVGHLCGDVELKHTLAVKTGCTKATVVQLTPGGTVPNVSEGSQTLFGVYTNASNNNNDLRYEWFVNNISQGAPSTSSSFSFTATTVGTHTVKVRVTNECTSAAENATATTTLQVVTNINLYPLESSGNYGLTGRECYDVSRSNSGGNCGSLDGRRSAFLDDGGNWLEGKQFTYSFWAGGPYTSLRFLVSDPSIVIKSQTTVGTSIVLTFDYSVLAKALGRDRNNALTVTVYALFEVGGLKRRVEKWFTIMDCSCCGAYIAPGNWKPFMCHNLGADQTLDPFVPARGLNGSYYAWGSKTPKYTVDSPEFALNYDGAKPSTSWQDGTKTANDPCPPGWRVPTSAQLSGMHNNNGFYRIGVWGTNPPFGSAQQYASGWRSNAILFPASGQYAPLISGEHAFYSSYANNKTNKVQGMYWSSTVAGHSNGIYTAKATWNRNGYEGSGPTTGSYEFRHTLTIRCIAE